MLSHLVERLAEPAEFGLAYIAQFRSVAELWDGCGDNREKFTGIIDRIEFWQKFGPAILSYAKSKGNDDFFMFGEVFDGDPAYKSIFTTQGKLPATLDFGFQGTARRFASLGQKTDDLRDFFAKDDYYTDADSNAYSLPTFLGNHDMGRIGRFLNNDSSTIDPNNAATLLQRDKLAHALMFFARGMPVIYYGDEQGFTGDGGDKDARQDMMPSQVATYNDDNLIGTSATTADANFDQSHPLYQTLKSYADIRDANLALRRGAQIQRLSGSTIAARPAVRSSRSRRRTFAYTFGMSALRRSRVASASSRRDRSTLTRSGRFSIDASDVSSSPGPSW